MYLFGANGHGKVLLEIAEKNNFVITAFIDFDTDKLSLLGYKILHKIPDIHIDLVISIGDNYGRKNIVFQNSNFSYMTLIHPNASLSKRCKIDKGTVVMAGVSVNSNVLIAKHCIINTNSSIDHDCVIEDFVHISPNVALAGNITIGEGTHVGIGASVIQGTKIGKWCTIGAGAVIINDVPDGATIVGNPGKIIKIKEVSDL